MEELLRELKEAEINQGSDVDFYKGVVHALWRLGKVDTNKKMAMEDNLDLRLMQIK